MTFVLLGRLDNMTIIARGEDALVEEIIKADSLAVEGARGAVMMEFENEDVSIEILPRLSEWGQI